MRVITVARKPLLGSVAATVMRHGTGGLNIDGCRVAGNSAYRDQHKLQSPNTSPTSFCVATGYRMFQPAPEGRWPANFILQHTAGCQCRGAVQFQGHKDNRPTEASKRAYSVNWRYHPTPVTRRGYANEEGLEEALLWDCTPDCPVLAMDRESGPRDGCRPHLIKSAGKRGIGWGSINPKDGVEGFPDAGTASRFFKQVQTNPNVHDLAYWAAWAAKMIEANPIDPVADALVEAFMVQSLEAGQTRPLTRLIRRAEID